MQNARLDESQTGIRIPRRNINNIKYAYDTTLVAESEEELKSLLMKVKEESKKAGSKSRGITLSTRISIVKASVFPVVTYGSGG